MVLNQYFQKLSILFCLDFSWYLLPYLFGDAHTLCQLDICYLFLQYIFLGTQFQSMDCFCQVFYMLCCCLFVLLLFELLYLFTFFIYFCNINHILLFYLHQSFSELNSFIEIFKYFLFYFLYFLILFKTPTCAHLILFRVFLLTEISFYYV